jgi:hypothetical protein
MVDILDLIIQIMMCIIIVHSDRIISIYSSTIFSGVGYCGVMENIIWRKKNLNILRKTRGKQRLPWLYMIFFIKK